MRDMTFKDYNILNRATFELSTLSHTVNANPGHTVDYLRLEPGQTIFIEKIDWEYGVPGVNVPWPTSALEVSVASVAIEESPVREAEQTGSLRLTDSQMRTADNHPLVSNQVSRPHSFKPPRPAQHALKFSVSNGNNNLVQVYLKLTGTLVTPKPGAEISMKEMLGYLMLDSNNQGNLLLDEATADQLDQHIKAATGYSVRENLPGGFRALTALGGMTPEVQRALLGGPSYTGSNAITGQEQPTALPNVQHAALPVPQDRQQPSRDIDKDISAFVGDAILGLSADCHLSAHQLQQLAQHMISRGWTK